MNKKQEEKGITLIALIITIIIMLILVGVTISISLQGGLFGYAKKAAKDTKNALEYENSLAEGIINGQTIDDIVGTAVADDWYEAPAEELKIDKDGNYHISTCAELALFAKTVNEGNDFAGKTVYLDKNLDLQGNENKQWTPIGIRDVKPFNGTFDGKNHYISGIYINTTEDGFAYGLFGYVNSGNIQGIGVINGYIKGRNSTGGIVGEFLNENGYIKNCYNLTEVEGSSNAGGIVGFNYGTIENCYNVGKITVADGGDGAGGIAGNAAFCTVKECYNKGEIVAGEGNCSWTGGIVGWSEEARLTIENCYNIGNINGKTSGGIVGFFASYSEISNCYNIGTIDGSENIGEIVGIAISEISENCYYKSGTTNEAAGKIDGNVTVKATAKTEEEMKADAFVGLLNNGGTAWKKDTGINKGYPILSWQ